jgi:hypothetical protein
MERNTKILLGLGAVALAYYLYTKNKAKSDPQAPSKPQTTPDLNKKLSDCMMDLASVRMTKEGYEYSIANCMGCNKGLVFNRTTMECEKANVKISQTESTLRKFCEKRIDDAVMSGKPLPAMPKEGLIRQCMEANRNALSNQQVGGITIYTCKDGSKEEVNEMQKVKREPPCKNKGGIINSTFK